MSELAKMVEGYFHKLLDLRPFWGSDLGLEEFDDLMPSGGRGHLEELSALYESFHKDTLTCVDETLSFDEKIDKECLLYSLSLDLFKLREIKLWRSYPSAPDSVGSALYTLLTRDSSPFDKRIRSIIERMKQIPRYLKESKELMERPVWIWVEIGIESCHRMRGFLEHIENIAKSLLDDQPLLQELAAQSEKARNAFIEYEGWLYTEILPRSEAAFTLTEDQYDTLLEKRMLGLTRPEILALGEEYVKSIRSEIKTIARRIDSSASLEEILKGIQENHPRDFEHVLEECRELMRQAREFVGSTGFATLPENDVLDIQETPIFMRHFIPFAAYSSPGKFDKVQKGIYMITPVEGSPENLSRFCYDDLVNTSVHEGYPGHHLQLTCANTNPSLARLFSHASEFCEGWAHYCEDSMAEAGFKSTPQSALIRVKDMLWRAWRIIIDIKLCTGIIPFEEAIRLLIEEVGMDEVPALAEVKRYTYTPAYQLSYLTGKHLLKSLKSRMKSQYMREFSQKEFHDTMLYAGNLPIALIEKVLGEKLGKMKV